MNIMMMIIKISTVTILIGNLMHGPPYPSAPLLHLILIKKDDGQQADKPDDVTAEGDLVVQTEKY